jgi:hypothetical protein
MPTAPAPVVGGHVWLASGISIVVLLVATWALYGFNRALLVRIIIGADNRASTSKFQATAWTYVILFALVTLLVGHLLYADFDPGWNTFLDEGLNSDYLWLLGIPSVGLVGAKAITQSKVEENPDAKPSKPDDAPADVLTRVRTRTRELASNDNDADPQPALGDLQYLVFNAVAVIYFLSAFLGHVERGLPSLPDTLIALTGVSAASYLSAKAVAKTAPPAIVSVRPSRVVLGAAPTDLTVSGTGFLGATGTGGEPGVTLGGVELDVTAFTGERLTAVVPDAAEATAKGLVADELQLVVYTPGGQPSQPTTIAVS